MANKHIPQRTCIACRAIRNKRELIRIVRTPENHVEEDRTGKKSGRGAYLCRQRECWETILNDQHRLAQALKLEMAINLQDLASLREFAATLPPRVDSAPASEPVTAGKANTRKNQAAPKNETP